MRTSDTELSAPADADSGYLSLADLARRWGIGRTAARAVTAADDFPAPLVLGRQLVRWPTTEVAEWESVSRRRDKVRRVLRPALRPSGRHLVVVAQDGGSSQTPQLRLVERRKPAPKAA